MSDSLPSMTSEIVAHLVHGGALPLPTEGELDLALTQSYTQLFHALPNASLLTDQTAQQIIDYHTTQQKLARASEQASVPARVKAGLPKLRRAAFPPPDEHPDELALDPPAWLRKAPGEEWLIRREYPIKKASSARKVLRAFYQHTPLDAPQDQADMLEPLNSLKQPLKNRACTSLPLDGPRRVWVRARATEHRNLNSETGKEQHEQHNAESLTAVDLGYLIDDAENAIPLMPRPPMLPNAPKPAQREVDNAPSLLAAVEPELRVPTSPSGRAPSQEQINRTDGISFEGVFGQAAGSEPRARPIWSSDGVQQPVKLQNSEQEPPRFPREAPPPPLPDPHKLVQTASSNSTHAHGISSEGHARDLAALGPGGGELFEYELRLPQSVFEVDQHDSTWPCLSKQIKSPKVEWPAPSEILCPALCCKLSGINKLSKELHWTLADRKPWASLEEVAGVADAPAQPKQALKEQPKWSQQLEGSGEHEHDLDAGMLNLSLISAGRWMVRAMDESCPDEMLHSTRAPWLEEPFNLELSHPASADSDTPLLRPRPIRPPSRVAPEPKPQPPASELPPSSPSSLCNFVDPDFGELYGSTLESEAVEEREAGVVTVFKVNHWARASDSDDVDGGDVQLVVDESVHDSHSSEGAVEVAAVERPKRASAAVAKSVEGEVTALMRKRRKQSHHPTPIELGVYFDILRVSEHLRPQPPPSVKLGAQSRPAQAQLSGQSSKPPVLPPAPIPTASSSRAGRLTPPYEQLPFIRAKFETDTVPGQFGRPYKLIANPVILRDRELCSLIEGVHQTLPLVSRPERGNLEPHLIVDGLSCVIVKKLVTLPGRVRARKEPGESMEALLKQLMLSFDRVLVILELEVGPSARASWTPPILSALADLASLVQSNERSWHGVDIQICFAAGVEAIAGRIERFVLWCAERAEEQLGQFAADGGSHDGWDDRGWLADSAGEEEVRLLDTLKCLNWFQVGLISSMCSADEFIYSLDSEERNTRFEPVCGKPRIEHISAQIEDIIVNERESAALQQMMHLGFDDEQQAEYYDDEVAYEDGAWAGQSESSFEAGPAWDGAEVAPGPFAHHSYNGSTADAFHRFDSED